MTAKIERSDNMLQLNGFKPELKELCEKLKTIRDTELSSDRYLKLQKLRNEIRLETLILCSSSSEELIIKLALEHLKDLFYQADEIVSKGQEKEADDINPKVIKIISMINCH